MLLPECKVTQGNQVDHVESGGYLYHAACPCIGDAVCVEDPESRLPHGGKVTPNTAQAANDNISYNLYVYQRTSGQ